MPAVSWDPHQYLRYSDARSRPFFDLIGQVRAETPRVVVDAGCGPGNLTASLAERWPDADVLGFDSSPAMIEQAQQLASDRVSFAVGDATTWQPAEPVDVLISNATLQWIEGHDALAARWLTDAVAPGGWLAFQVPGNMTSPSHVQIRELLAEPHWRETVPPGTGLRVGSFDPEYYADVLADGAGDVNAWETTYMHLLQGDDPVLEWVKGTALRPILGALEDGDLQARFLRELGARLRVAYPAGRHGTLFPFRRVFVVAQRRR